MTPIPLDLDPLWGAPAEAAAASGPEATSASAEGGPELEHYDLYADALVPAGEGVEEGGDPDEAAPVVRAPVVAAGPRKAAPLLTLEEAQARLPDGVKERLAEKLRGNFREVRRYRPRA